MASALGGATAQPVQGGAAAGEGSMVLPSSPANRLTSRGCGSCVALTSQVKQAADAARRVAFQIGSGAGAAQTGGAAIVGRGGALTGIRADWGWQLSVAT